MPPSDRHTHLALAMAYLARGWRVVPLAYKTKRPLDPDWMNSNLGEAQLRPRYASGSGQSAGQGGRNIPGIGILLSGPIKDVDLDCEEAIELAPYFLPETTHVFGRASKPRSHWIYSCPGMEESHQFADPTRRGQGSMLVELRATGQTVFPPSIHVSGETVSWEGNRFPNPEPTAVDGVVLEESVSALAAATLLARHWPAQGQRHQAALNLAGGLMRGGWDLEHTTYFVEQVIRHAFDDEAEDRLTAIATTFARGESGENTTGWHSLVDQLGSDVVGRVRAWLGMQGNGLDSRLHLTDFGNCDRLMDLHGQNVRYCWPWKRWLRWDGKHWRPDAGNLVIAAAVEAVSLIPQEANGLDEEAQRTIWKWARTSESERYINAMVSLTRSRAGIPVQPEDMDANPWLLSVLNGTINLRTGELLPHQREDLITNLVKANYDPTATCPTWDGFLERIMVNRPELVSFLRRAVGYSLTGDTSEQVMFICYGPQGENGKSTMLNVFRTLLGGYAKNADFQAFLLTDRTNTGIRNDLAALKSARLVTSIEVEEGRRLATALIKQVTGGDPITARFLHAEFFEYRPQFKLWFAVNHLPNVGETAHAFWRRVRLIPFDYRVTEEERDPHFEDRLQEELPGILAWAVKGCLEWQRNGLGTPTEVVESTRQYRQVMDMVAEFISDECIQSPDQQARSQELYRRFEEWCNAHGLNGPARPTQMAFSLRLAERGLEKRRGRSGWIWHGIGLHENGAAGTRRFEIVDSAPSEFGTPPVALTNGTHSRTGAGIRPAVSRN